MSQLFAAAQAASALYLRKLYIPIPSNLQMQRKQHDSDEEQLAAAKAFLEQHLKQGANDPAAPAAAQAAHRKDKGKSSSKGSAQEKAAGSLPTGTSQLTEEDYFEKSAEFTAWLQESKHQYFNGECRLVWSTGP